MRDGLNAATDDTRHQAYVYSMIRLRGTAWLDPELSVKLGRHHVSIA